MNNADLQFSKIKNAYNYFQYISKLLPLKMNVQDDHEYIYLVGDSHCLSPAWGVIQLQHKTWKIKPLLVTGCKIWHLRDTMPFHAKTNFYRAIEAIPTGSTAMLIFGEIDCREGILRAIQKGDYTTPEKAINVLIDIYVKRMLETIKARKLAHLYIHQIPPVLNATRFIVNEFNRLLEIKLRALNSNLNISWLGFEGGLLAENGKFNANFDIDETLIHPDYIHTHLLAH